MDVSCKHCGRFLFKQSGTVILEQLPCPNSKCKARLNIKIVTSDSALHEIKHKFATQEVPPKTT